jgi:hypothetical protein
MKLRLPRLGKSRPFRLFVVNGDDAPPDRWFGSLAGALRAADRLDEPWRRRAWIIEYEDQPSFGGIPVVRDVVHMRDGERTGAAETREYGA